MRDKTVCGVGTYTSRYSDYDGYWLFGFLVSDLAEVRINLLEAPSSESDIPAGTAARPAARKFADQTHKAGLVPTQIKEAWLTIRKLSTPVGGLVNGFCCTGHNVRFFVEAVVDGGRRYEREKVMFIAPHRADIESRSTRAAEPGI